MEGMGGFTSIPNYANYFIDMSGVLIRKYKNGNYKVIKPHLNSNGYLRYTLSKDGKRKHKYIHQLLATCFLKNPEGKKCIDHIDRNRLNNKLTNLRYTTYKENSRNKTRSKRNKIFRGVIRLKKKGIDYYAANWSDDTGKRKFKYYNIGLLGEELAKISAIKRRLEMEKLYYNYL
jgi:hypothetical protein